MRVADRVSDKTGPGAWVTAIARRANERERRRQILNSRTRQAGVRLGRYVADQLPDLVPEFVKMLLGSLVAFWIITSLIALIFHMNPLYTLLVLGFVYSMQATYYKYRLSVDPDYQIPRCRCANRRIDGTESVLRSGQSTILRIPTSALGAVLYAAMLPLVFSKHTDIATPLAVTAVLVSAYLSYVMVVRIRSLCVNCINVAALNLLILWQFLG
jgi:uncharacterized membrane protein